MKITIHIILIFALTSCNPNLKSTDKEASIKLNNEATQTNYLFNKDSIKKGIALLDKALKFDNKNSAAYSNKIGSYMKLNEYNEAYNTFLTAKENIKEYENWIMMEYILLEKLNKHNQAINVLNKGQKIIEYNLKKKPQNTGLILEKFLIISVLKDKQYAINELTKYYQTHDPIDVSLHDAINIIETFKVDNYIE